MKFEGNLGKPLVYSDLNRAALETVGAATSHGVENVPNKLPIKVLLMR